MMQDTVFLPDGENTMGRSVYTEPTKGKYK